MILQEWAFEVNPHAWCVTNNTVNIKQMTLVWPMDDMKIYHENKDTVDALINKLSE